jgi:quinoprotein glucose dehydrogenase
LCRRQIERLRPDGLYTPPSLRGSIVFPFTGGGVNWGGGAFDREDGLFIVNAMSVAHVVRLIPRADYAAARAAAPKAEIGLGLGTPYAAERTLLTSIFGIPCMRRPGAHSRPLTSRREPSAGKSRSGRWPWGSFVGYRISAVR